MVFFGKLTHRPRGVTKPRYDWDRIFPGRIPLGQNFSRTESPPLSAIKCWRLFCYLTCSNWGVECLDRNSMWRLKSEPGHKSQRNLYEEFVRGASGTSRLKKRMEYPENVKIQRGLNKKLDRQCLITTIAWSAWGRYFRDDGFKDF